MKWGMDVSVYQDLSPDKWAELKTNGLAFVIIRACQGHSFTDQMLETHIGRCKDNGIPFGVYQWVDPIQSPARQADYYLALIEKYQPTCAAADFEQWWSDWDAWYAKTVQQQDVQVPVMAPATLNTQYKAYTDYLVPKLKIPFIAYSGAWFINNYVPEMAQWVKALPYYWTANYIKWVDPDGDQTCSWPKFQQLLGTLGNPRLPKEIDKWTIWQFTSRLPLNDLPYLTLNVIPDEAAYQALFGGLKPLEPGTHYRVTANALNVREAPSIQAKVIGYLSHDQTVERLGASADEYWYQIKRADGLQGWSSHKFLVAADHDHEAQPGDSPWLAVAFREVGQRDYPDTQTPAENPRILEYLRSTTLPAALAASDETPWCSAFVNWCMEQAGYEGTDNAGARSWLNWGKAIDQPARGCIVVFSRVCPDGSVDTCGHVGFYLTDDQVQVEVLGGNQAETVNILAFDKGRVLGYRLPGP